MQLGGKRLVAVCIVVALLAGGVGGIVGGLYFSQTASGEESTEQASKTPGMDYIDLYSCAPGLEKRVAIHGAEDGFDRAGEEPANVRPALLEFAGFADMENRRFPLGAKTRDYDERGQDKFLIDHFEIEPGVLSGVLVTSLLPQGSNENDDLTLGDRSRRGMSPSERGTPNFAAQRRSAEDGSWLPFEGLMVWSLDDLHPMGMYQEERSFLDYLNKVERPLALDLVIAEDTAVDFAAIITCHEPSDPRGTAFREHSIGYRETGLSYLGCHHDEALPMCEPDAGHISCDVPVPIACYREGSKKAPELDRNRVPVGYFIPGEVRLSRPTQGSRLKTLEEAGLVCKSQFGPDWRVLSYHEAGGTAVLSYSDIAPAQYGLVHIGDRPYGNCWDRPESVIGK